MISARPKLCYKSTGGSFRHGAGLVLKIAITGGNGFVGSDLAILLAQLGHQVVIVSRRQAPRLDFASTISADINDLDSLLTAFASCDAVAHCAGINRQQDTQTFKRVHVEGTKNVVSACQKQGVKKLVLTSFLKARADSGSPYHESKWLAEEVVRSCDLDYTILKPGVIFGQGDHMIKHMSSALKLSPFFALIGADVSLRPVALADFSRIIAACLHDARLSKSSFAVLGPEKLRLSEAARRVASAMGRPVIPVPMPLAFCYALAHVLEATMKEPLLSIAQIKMIAEGLAEVLPGERELPDDLKPRLVFSLELLKAAL